MKDPDPEPDLQHRRPDHQGSLRPRPAQHRHQGREVPQVHRHRRHRLLRPRGRVLHLRRGALRQQAQRHLLRDRLERGRLEHAARRRANRGYKIRHKEGYFPVAPLDSQQDIRTEMCLVLADVGIEVERQHHEVATAGQAEIDFRFNTLVKCADNLSWFKYIVKNVAWRHGKTATFMPKPLFGDNGSRHAHPPVAVEERQAALRRRRIRRAERDGALLHRRHPQARPGAGGASATRPPTATSGWCRASRRR